MKIISRVLLAALRYIFLCGIILISVGPFLWVLISSFKTTSEIAGSALALPQSLYLQNYITVFEKSPVLKFFFNSAFIAAVSIFASLLIFGMCAYVLARHPFRGSKLLYMVLSVSVFVPATSVMLPTYLLIRNLGIYDTKLALVLVYCAFSLPFCLFILRSYFLTIPKDMESSAYVDGAGFFRTYVQIILPMARPGLASAAVMVFLTAWNDYFFSMLLTSSENNRTMPLAIKYFTSSVFGTNLGAIFAVSVVIVTPSIIVYILLQDKIRAGLTEGAVKG